MLCALGAAYQRHSGSVCLMGDVMDQRLDTSQCTQRAGIESLREPLVNRGLAFTRNKRLRAGLEGLLPSRVESIEEQTQRVMANVRAKANALEQYIFLNALRNENETLFYHAMLEHVEEMLPIIYTPTVGQACQEWSRIYDRPRGLYISARHRGRIADILRNWPQQRVGIIVVTDGGRILGLGDLGANGMGIPIGKLSLYTACAGVRPELCLPILLDAGTDNEALRADPFYIGEREMRMKGRPYDALLEEFMLATQQVFPGAIIQFEDFNTACAFPLLRRYRERFCCFNDDIQGTGAMGLAALYAAGRITSQRLSAQRVLFVGAGEACTGIGSIVVAAMQREGLTETEARANCLFMDSRGLVVASRKDLSAHKLAFVQERAPVADLISAVQSFRPGVLIGASGKGGIFTQAVLEAMSRVSARPIVFALSNPTSKAECTAEQAYAWTGGRCIFASGSPFGAVSLGGRTFCPGQANNSYVFPGIGLGLLVSGARRVTDEMFFAAAEALAEQVTAADLEQGRIFPVASCMRAVAAAVAAAVAKVAHDQGHASVARPRDYLAAAVQAMYRPQYA